MTQPFSPAHDLVGEQHSAHFRVLVLPFIDNGLEERGRTQAQGEGGSSYVTCRGRDGFCPVGRSCLPSCLGDRRVQSRSWASGSPNQDYHQGGPEWHEVCRFCLSTDSFFQFWLCLGPGWSQDQAPRSGWDGGRHSYPTIPMDLCFCAQVLSCRLPQPAHQLSLAQVSVSPLDYSISLLMGPPLSAPKQGASFLNRESGFPFYNPPGLPSMSHLWGPFLTELSSTSSTLVPHTVLLCHCSFCLFPPTRTTGFLETNHFFLCPEIGWKPPEDPAVWESPSLHVAFGGPLISPFQALLPHQCIQLLCKAHQGAEGLQ